MIHCGDCLQLMRVMPNRCVDLVFCSPPYEAARTYGIGFSLKGQDYVNWCVERFIECYRLSRGLVAWVIEGQTRDFEYSAVPALLMADLHRAGVKLRKPPVFHRVGIPGSGGPDWLRNDWEWIVCASHGKLPWSDNTAMGHAPKWAPGGEMSHRTEDGRRKNARNSQEAKKRRRDAFGFTPHIEPSQSQRREGMRRSGIPMRIKRTRLQGDRGGHTADGWYEWTYVPPKKANPGNVIKCIVGGGVMGSKLCHENEAPFPESLAEFFIRSFCPEGGTVLDPFCGSGTTLAVAERLGRKWIGIDVRDSQVELSKRRIEEVRLQV